MHSGLGECTDLLKGSDDRISIRKETRLNIAVNFKNVFIVKGLFNWYQQTDTDIIYLFIHREAYIHS